MTKPIKVRKLLFKLVNNYDNVRSKREALYAEKLQCLQVIKNSVRQMCKETDTLEIMENINKIETLECKQLHTGNQYLEETCGMPGIEEDKLREKGNMKSRIPQIMSPTAARLRGSSRKTTESHSFETTRPKSATTRLPPTHPTQLLQGTRLTRLSKERPALKRPPFLTKMTPPAIRSTTPVIKVPFTTLQAEMSGREDRDTDESVCSNTDDYKRKKLGEKFFPEDKKRMQLKKRWQENIAEFESTKQQLYDKQQSLLKLYATLRASHKELLNLGQTMCLPPSDDLKIMNVAQLDAEQLLQLCAGPGFSVTEIIHTKSAFDALALREIRNKIVSTCEQTLNSRKEIINWFEEVMAKKMITKTVLGKKIKDFKAENEELKRTLDKDKEDFLRFLTESDESFKKGVNNSLASEMRLQNVSYKLSEMNALNEDLQNKLLKMEEKLMSSEKKSAELEKQLRDEKHRKRDHLSRADIHSKSKEEKFAQINAALEQEKSKNLSLENTVLKLREENQEIQASYDKKMKTIKESIDINTKLFDEITADRSKLLTEKQDLEQQLLVLHKKYEEALHNAKDESISVLSKLVETEKKYSEVFEEKNKMADKIESMCAQLLESELRFKDASKRLAEMEINSRDLADCRAEIEKLNPELENAKEELLEYQKFATKQNQAMQELRDNWNNAMNSIELLKSELNSKEISILELECQRTDLEKRLQESELRTNSYVEELTNFRNQFTLLQDIYGGFENFEELQEKIRLQTFQLTEFNQQNKTLTETLEKIEIELQHRAELIAEQKNLFEEREAAMKMLTEKDEEQSNIIKLLRNNLDLRTQADIEINRQLAEKNTEIESLIANVEKRKEQISQLEQIILTLENQIVRLSDQKRTAREAISSLEAKLCEYESYYVTNAKKTESSADNLDDLINILEDELTNPYENHLNRELSGQKLTGRPNKRGTLSTFRSHHENKSDIYHSQENVPLKANISHNLKNTTNLNKGSHKGDGNKSFKRVLSSEYSSSPKAPATATVPKDIRNINKNVNFCLIPNCFEDERKLKMFKLAGHKLR